MVRWLEDFPFWLYQVSPQGTVLQSLTATSQEKQGFPLFHKHEDLYETYRTEYPEILEGLDKARKGERVNAMLSVKDVIYSAWMYPIVRDNKVESVYCVLADINENIEIHDEIIRKINFFEKVQRVGKVGIFEADLASGKTYWAEETYKIYGCKYDFQPRVEHSFGFVHDDDIQNVLAVYYQALQSERYYKLNYRIRTEERSTRYIEVHGEIIRDGNGRAAQLFGVVRDITEESRYKAMLQDNNQKLNSILESMTEGFLAVEKDHEIRYVNRAAVQMLKQERPELLGQDIRDIKLLRDSREWQEHYQRANQAQTAETFEWWHPVREEWFEITFTPLPEGFSVLLTNIHAHKTIADSLKEINEAKDRLFSIIAHDLKSPLNNIAGIMHLYESFGENMTREELVELFEQTHKASQNAYDLLEDLLTWSRNQMDNQGFSPKEISLHEIVERVVAQKQMPATSKSIQLRYYAKPKTCCFGDADMIGTVLRNFIANAIKFTPHGGKISVHIREASTCVMLGVSDTGIGMEQDTVDNLFRIDKKVRSKGTDGEQGSGLGLKICKQLIDKHNGEIRVRSHPGKGSLFTVILPKLKAYY